MVARKKHAKPLKQEETATRDFERLLKRSSADQHYVLRLYVTGSTPRSVRAIANIHALCEDYLAGHYELEVVDIYQQPSVASHNEILAAPTLVKELPAPARRLIGDLSDRDKLLVGLNLTPQNSSSQKEKTIWLEV